VLDLTPVALSSCSCADVFEPFWNGSIERWLANRELVAKQRKRVESRRLRDAAPTREDLMPVLVQLQARIEAAAAALGK
jgi:hypothetical protein